MNTIKFTFLILFMMVQNGCDGTDLAKGFDPEVRDWQQRFLEFHSALTDYNSRENYDYSDEAPGKVIPLFPADFSILSDYGDGATRRYLKSKKDWYDFEHSVTILEYDSEFYIRERMEPESILASKWIIMERVVIQSDNSKVKVILTYGGFVYANIIKS